MATVAEIRDRAAQDLGIVRIGQSLQAQDAARIEAAYNEVYAQLKAYGVAMWTSTGDIPTSVVPLVSSLICDNCLSTYKVSENVYIRIKNIVGALNGDKAKREISFILSPNYVSMTEVRDY